MKTIYTFLLLLLMNHKTGAQCNSAVIYNNESTNAVCFENTENTRHIYTNNIPDHTYGPFGGPNDIAAQDFEYNMCLHPTLSTFSTPLSEDETSQGCGGGIVFGLSHQGVLYSPFARLYWVNPNTQQENKEFEIEAEFTLNIDINGGHVNNLSRYHYHSAPVDYLTNDLGVDGSSHSPLLGYAADGFPIYYKYLYSDPMNALSNITEFKSDYQLKLGSRSGNGITAPDGEYDGTYIQDYEHIPDQSELDECGGRFGVTPEYPKGTYYYVLTDNWPYIPRCLKGETIDNSFKIGPNCPASTASTDCATTSTVNVLDFINTVSINTFPNPTRTTINLSINQQLIHKVTSLLIYNSIGEIVFISNVYQESIQIEHLPKGSYYIQIEIEQKKTTKKFIVQ